MSIKQILWTAGIAVGAVIIARRLPVIGPMMNTAAALQAAAQPK
jgi:class 3 adenylate cyclase